MIVGGAGDQNAARLAKLLEASGDIDTISQQVASFDDYVAQIDADAKDDAPLGQDIRLPRGNRFLHGDRALDRIDDGGELGKNAISEQLDQAAIVFRQEWINDLAVNIVQCIDGADLVLLDKTRIADDIRHQDRREPPLDARCCHGYIPSTHKPCLPRPLSGSGAKLSGTVPPPGCGGEIRWCAGDRLRG